MPKKIVDYSKTVMYKIVCDDDDSDFVYIGHTTNFVKRKCAHKSFTNGIKNNRKLYRLIRANGGWTNFRMLEIEKYACNDKREAEAREDALMQELKPNMNSSRACRNKKQYYQDNKKQFLKMLRNTINALDKLGQIMKLNTMLIIKLKLMPLLLVSMCVNVDHHVELVKNPDISNQKNI
jgi:hypothetical protein